MGLRDIVERVEFDDHIADDQSHNDRDGEKKQSIPHRRVIPQRRKNGQLNVVGAISTSQTDAPMPVASPCR